QAEDGIRDRNVTGVQTCALPIYILHSFCAKTKNVAQNVAEMSLKCRRLQTLAPPGFVRCFSQIWHSALKRGVVVAPLFLSPYPQNPKKQKIKKHLKRYFFINSFLYLFLCSFPYVLIAQIRL